MLVQLARVLIETTRTGFPEKAKGRSSSNEFVRANKNFVEVDENYEATIDLEKLQVSGGKLPCFFEVTVTYNADGRMLTFQQEAQSNSLLNSDPEGSSLRIYPRNQDKSQRNRIIKSEGRIGGNLDRITRDLDGGKL